jgi:hypothetical protein
MGDFDGLEGGGEEGREGCEAIAALIESDAIETLISSFLDPLPKVPFRLHYLTPPPLSRSWQIRSTASTPV